MKETDMGDAVRRYAFTVADYHRMGEAGIFAGGPRVELLGGEVVEMSPIGGRHAACVNKVARLLITLYGEDAVVQIQNPVVLDDYSEPEPDISVLLPRADFYADPRPGPADTLLAIEIADSSLRLDRRVKAPLYAAAGVPLLWIVDLNAEAVDVYSEPSASGFGLVRHVTRGATLSLPIRGGILCTVDDLLP